MGDMLKQYGKALLQQQYKHRNIQSQSTTDMRFGTNEKHRIASTLVKNSDFGVSPKRNVSHNKKSQISNYSYNDLNFYMSKIKDREYREKSLSPGNPYRDMPKPGSMVVSRTHANSQL